LFFAAALCLYLKPDRLPRGHNIIAITTMAGLLAERDFATVEHANRMQDLVCRLAFKIGLSKNSIADLRLLAQFHDIGRVKIPDKILYKPGPLSESELQYMRLHPVIGYRIAKAMPGLAHIADWILKNHEWWNGNGYPFGYKGEEIPIECRILAIADAYDAMTNDRPYRKAMSQERAFSELKNYSGTQFDPELVEEFIEMLAES
jgi:HD-GYP domain-containing protein (c-di-GMP phosphodiesterase class II)